MCMSYNSNAQSVVTFRALGLQINLYNKKYIVDCYTIFKAAIWIFFVSYYKNSMNTRVENAWYYKESCQGEIWVNLGKQNDLSIGFSILEQSRVIDLNGNNFPINQCRI